MVKSNVALSKNLESLAISKNLEALAANPYPGRGLIVGLDQTGRRMVQVYWIMGRSENSRNRIFEHEGGRVFTVAADPSKLKDPSLIIYNAMLESERWYVVSNGDQTDTVIQEGFIEGKGFVGALRTRQYEPDAPNYTPRITAMCELELQPYVILSVLHKSREDMACVHDHYSFGRSAPLQKGVGWCVTTYTGDGDPLPSFVGPPYLLPLVGDGADIAQTYRQVLNPDHFVALVVKTIDIKTGESYVVISNKYQKVS